MKHLHFAIASIVDANTGFGLSHGGGKVDYEAGEKVARELRSSSVHDFFGAIGGIVRDAVTAQREKARQRRALEELSNLSDYYLDDVGLTRGDIAAVRLGLTSLETLDSDRRARLAVAPLDYIDTETVDDSARDTEAVNEAEYGASKCA